MAKIVVFGGTTEGRRIVERFANTELEIHICVATEYGGTLLPQADNIKIHMGRLDAMQMEALFSSIQPDCCVDATHPYAVLVTETVSQVCDKMHISYLRVARDCGKLQDASVDSGDYIYCDSVAQAADFLKKTNGNVLVTTGSKELHEYTGIEQYKERVFARVLPTKEVIEKCKELGFEGRNLIGMQGPFSEEMNYCMLKQIDAKWMVTKNSGKEGGLEEKCLAADRAGVKVLMIGRPQEPTQAVEISEAIMQLEQQYGITKKTKVYLIGMGPGKADLLTERAKQCLERCDVLIGGERVLSIAETISEAAKYISYKKDEIMQFIAEHPEYQTVGLCYSGDISLYSGANGMRAKLLEQGFEVETVSGISSVTYFLDQIGIARNQVQVVSCHGVETNLIPLIRTNRYVCTLLGDREKVADTCRKLCEYGFENITVTVGEQLSYAEERIISKPANKWMNALTDSLAVALFENPNAIACENIGIADEEFVRGKTPMTKEEVRTISIAKLQLKPDSVVYDVGAGTGSVSVEMARMCPKGKVYAIEKKDDAIELLRENQQKFQVENMEIIEGTAPEALYSLPVPTHAFIGGSSGQMLEIIQEIYQKNPKARFVINAISLETLGLITRIAEKFPEYEDIQVVQMQISRGKKMGNYHLMNGENPVYIISFGGV